MFQGFRAFSDGWRFHIKGIRFAFQHLSFLALSALPFVIALCLYVFAFYLFTQYADDLLGILWHLESGESSRYVGWLYWAYIHLVKVLLYIVILVVMFYTFIVLANILASPVYDYLVSRYQRTYYPDAHAARAISPVKGILFVMKEEVKKAALMLVIPLLLLLIPVIGPLLGFVVAALFIAWDYVDFSLSRDYPLLKDRIKALWRHKAFFLGFGCPLLIPLLGLVILPFAILGATRLYFDRMREAPEIEETG